MRFCDSERAAGRIDGSAARSLAVVGIGDGDAVTSGGQSIESISACGGGIVNACAEVVGVRSSAVGDIEGNFSVISAGCCDIVCRASLRNRAWRSDDQSAVFFTAVEVGNGDFVSACGEGVGVFDVADGVRYPVKNINGRTASYGQINGSVAAAEAFGRACSRCERDCGRFIDSD